ncbi:MAG: hypothetical protein MJE63_06510, partial [Proteobacteria bacterium]|nr:hypothetical protein [Pseudomonadota bacterium]
LLHQALHLIEIIPREISAYEITAVVKKGIGFVDHSKLEDILEKIIKESLSISEIIEARTTLAQIYTIDSDIEKARIQLGLVEKLNKNTDLNQSERMQILFSYFMRMELETNAENCDETKRQYGLAQSLVKSLIGGTYNTLMKKDLNERLTLVKYRNSNCFSENVESTAPIRKPPILTKPLSSMSE